MARWAFFGTPDFSLASLMAVNRLCKEQGHDLVLVVSQKDQKQGRGKKLLPCAVKRLALQQSLNICQPETLKKNTPDGDQFFNYFSSLKIDLAVVVAYGKIISKRLLAVPKFGFVNVHASLLPRFRGAAPIQRALEEGDKKSGVCLMDMVFKLDEGDVFTYKSTPIIPSDTAKTLSRRLSILGANLLYENLGALLLGAIPKTPQAQTGIIYAHMLKKEEGLLSFLEPGLKINNKVRAFDPWPGTFGFIKGKRLRFFDAFFINDNRHHQAHEVGSVVCLTKFLGIKTIDGVIYFSTIQVEGKTSLSVKEALLGFKIKIGDQIKNNADQT